MDRRPELQALLEVLLGSRSVYFQPPSNLKMTYPAVVYEQDQEVKEFAGNLPYTRTLRWQITLISQDPDNPMKDAISALPMSSFVRSFASDNLNHVIYSLYF